MAEYLRILLYINYKKSKHIKNLLNVNSVGNAFNSITLRQNVIIVIIYKL